MVFAVYVVICIWSIAPKHGANGEIFASIVDLTHVLKAEQSVIKSMKEYVSKEVEKLTEITDMVSAMEDENGRWLQEPLETLADITTAFKTIDRFTNIWWKQKEILLSNENTQNLMRKITDLTQFYPDERDIKRASDSIFRIQDVYQVDVKSFANGSVTENGNQMSAYDCFQVAIEAFKANDIYHAIAWFEESRRLYMNGYDEHINGDEIYKNLIFSYYLTNEIQNLQYIIKLLEEWDSMSDDKLFIKNAKKYFKNLLDNKIIHFQQNNCSSGDINCKNMMENKIVNNDSPVNERKLSDWEKNPDYERFETLCRGENVYTSHRLYCRLKRNHPYFIISPVKEEILSFDPFIAIFHDFINAKEITKLKKLATPKLERSTTFATRDQEDKEHPWRTSKTAWISDDDPVIARITRKSVALANLKNWTAEMQVVCYGLGGQYGPHFDWVHDGNLFGYLGNRIATVVHYLSDFKGGSTAFMNVGVKVPPKKGTTLFWWNLKRNLDGDERTLHAGCPVIYGNKWIANKWIHTKAQWSTRPCLLDKET